ncbi:polyphosphate kinase 2 family protein [Akkermansiaceae bacterium]|nr:polyphosphate kinase 2 family protein [Akkermansiaceae bacterium]
MEKTRETYLVKPGQQVAVGGEEASDKALYNGNKASSKKPLKGILDSMLEEQTKLYAGESKKLLVVIQAMDTGGKDGCVKSVFATVDPKGINVECFKKPSSDELDHDYLWRIHKKVPRKGMITVFNRSHYEDIIAVKVKNIYPESVWQKRYQHIIDFEKMLSDEGVTIVKIFLNISKDEQKERLQARLDDPSKHWKFNPGDLDDRKRWDDFMAAYQDLFARTSTETAPWYVVPANSKYYRNLAVSQIITDTLKDMKLDYPVVDWKPEDFDII